MKKFDDFSMEKLMQLAQSEAGQQLMAMLQTDHADAVKTVRQNQNDIQSAKAALSDFLADPKAQALLRQLQEDYHG